MARAALLLLPALAAADLRKHMRMPTHTAELRTSNVLDAPSFSGARAMWEKDVALPGDHRVTVGIVYDYPLSDNFVSELSLRGCAPRDLMYELRVKSPLGKDVQARVTHLDLTQLLRQGFIAMASLYHDGPLAHGFSPSLLRVKELSFFHTAGVVNVQPCWLPQERVIRLKVGEGRVRRRCPVSLQLDRSLADGTTSVEVGARHVMDGRMLTARLFPTLRQLRLVYTDSRFEEDGDWEVTGVFSPRRDGGGNDEANPVVGPLGVSVRRVWRW
jgi:hypothetical protein